MTHVDRRQAASKAMPSKSNTPTGACNDQRRHIDLNYWFAVCLQVKGVLHVYMQVWKPISHLREKNQPEPPLIMMHDELTEVKN
jgi:hypothetical protein